MFGFPLVLANLEGAEVIEAGALAKNGKWEVSVDYADSIARNSVVDIANYSIPGAAGVAIEGIRYIPLNNAVVLTVTGLRTNDLYSVAIQNLRDTNGTLLPEARAGFIATHMSWAAIGSQELGFSADTVIIGTNNFDLVSGGSQMRGEYDESTFAYERVTGDFDKRVRIHFQEPSSEAARAGLMVREFLDEGSPRPINPGDPQFAFSRYLQVQANPAETAFTEDGATVPGNNMFQINVRYFYPGFEGTENPAITNNAAPAGANTWVRLRRVGDLFEAFRGVDGTNWVSLGSFRFPATNSLGEAVAPFSTNVFVGPNYSPELDNIPESSGARRAFLAQFREYGDTGLLPDVPPSLIIERLGNEVEIKWDQTGTLQSSTNLSTNVWTDITTTNPARRSITNRYEFFRVRIP